MRTAPEAGARTDRLGRLLAPRSIAVFGGRAAAETVRASRRMGFSGPVWPVHPHRDTLEGLPCYRSVADLPEAPDASFVGVSRRATVDVVAALSRSGAGGAVCYASGFAEAGSEGADLQQLLVTAAGDMPLLGPNSYGMLNYLDGAALWPDVHGGRPVERGVAVVSASGNLSLNLTMQRRGLPLAYLVAVGNMAVTGVHDIVDALLADPRVTAVGLHLEGLTDVAAFSRAAVAAHDRRVPLVVLKSGGSALGASTALSHTHALAGEDTTYDALFVRLGVARVHDPATLLETLALCHVHGGLPGNRIASASCSGGEAALVADLAASRGVVLPDLPEPARARLRAVLGERVEVGNPLDYQTYIWGDPDAERGCFAGLLSAGLDLHLLVLDVPREDRCETVGWTTALDAFVAAQQETGARAAVASSLPEGLPEAVAERLLRAGIAPLHGLAEGLSAVAAAAQVGAAWRRVVQPLPGAGAGADGASAPVRPAVLSEWAAKQRLAARGIAVPSGRLVTAPEAGVAAEAAVHAAAEIGYPVVVKAVGASMVHKTEAGAVRLDLPGADEVRAAALALHGLSGALLVERMVRGAVAELIVGIRHDPQFGHVLTVGSGGVLVELVRDAVTLLLPAGPAEVRTALTGLRGWPLLTGYRGRPRGDVAAVLAAVAAAVDYVRSGDGRVAELDVNPLLVLPEGQGAVAADVLLVGWW